MKNRIASLFLVFALLMSLCSSAVARDNRITVQSGGAERFTDVPTSHWAYGYINKVVGSGLFNGRTETTFEPSSAMTRSQFVMVMARMEGRSDLEGVETQTIFPDVATTRRAAGPIAWANEQGFVNGFGDGTFKPDSPITRGQFAALIHRYIAAKGYTNLNAVDPEPAQFTDAASVSTAFTADVEYARIHGLLTGYSDGSVRSGNPITRAAIAAILARFLDLVSESKDEKTGDYYVPLLDYPRPDNGDSGDTTKPVDKPNPYDDDIKLKVSGEAHGSVPTIGVTRDGAEVDPDDVQPGDRVTITYKADNGYTASIRVRDANGKIITVRKTDSTHAWFVMPAEAASPVTVTVTYEKESSGSGGSSSTSSGRKSYYLRAAVDVTGNGVVYLAQDEDEIADAIENKSATLNMTNRTGNFSFYAAIKADAGWTLSSVTTTQTTPSFVENTTDGYAVYRITTTSSRTTYSANAPADITVNATFTSGTSQTWTLDAQGVNDGLGYAYFGDTAEAVATAAAAGTGAQTSYQASGLGTTVYVAIAPQGKATFGDESELVTTDATATIVKITADLDGATNDEKNHPSVDNQYYVYKITTTSTTTVVTDLSAKFVAPATAKYEVTFAVAWDDAYENVPDINDATAAKYVPADDVEPGAQVTEASAGEPLTVRVPYQSGEGYFAYKLTKVEAAYTFNGSPAKRSATAGDKVENTFLQDWTFASTPLADDGTPINVTAYYYVNPDDTLNYTFNVDPTLGTGTGSFTLYAGDSSVAVTDKATYMANPTDETASKIDLPTSYKEYVAKGFPVASDWQIEYYVSEPTPSADSVYVEDGGNVKDYVGVSKVTWLSPDASASVTAKFDKKPVYGYKLTVIGDGYASVSGLADRTVEGNSDSIPVTESSGLIETNTASVTVTAGLNENADAERWTDATVTATATNADGESYSVLNNNTVTLVDGQIVNIVVVFRDKNGKPVSFTVNVGNGGTVSMSPENGAILTSFATDDHQNELSAAGIASNIPVVSGMNYYALSGTIVTLNPKGTGTNKTYSISYDDKKNDANDDKDILGTAGYSFKLSNPDTTEELVATADVKFGSFKDNDAYKFALLAPVTTDWTALTRGLSAISSRINTDATIGDLLNALNNNADTTNIDNRFGSTPSNLASFLAYFLDQGDFVSNLESTLTDSVVAPVQASIPDMIQAQVDAALASLNLGEVVNDINVPLPAAPAGLPGLPVNAPATSGAIAGNVVRKLLNSNEIASEDGAQVYLTGLTVKMSKNAATAGKSVEEQLTSILQEYGKTLEFANVEGNVNVALHVTNNQVSYPATDSNITISADVSFLNGNPTLNTPQRFSTFVGEGSLALFINVNAVVVDGNGAQHQYYDALPFATVAQDITSLNGYDATILNTLRTQLNDSTNGVEAKIRSTFNKTFADVADGGKMVNGVMPVDMSTSLKKDALDAAITAMLDKALDKIGSKVDGIRNEDPNGPYSVTVNGQTVKYDMPKTHAAFMQLYNDFVVFTEGGREVATDNGSVNEIIALKTLTEGVTKTLGTLENNNQEIVLRWNFGDILNDASAKDDTSFEKLMQLLINFRDGMATDIQTASADNGTNQTAEAVFASMLQGQIGGSGRGDMLVKKWNDTEKSVAKGSTEAKEVSELLAKLMMSKTSETVNNAWADFEAQGYRSVAFQVRVNPGKGGNYQYLANAMNNTLGSSSVANKLTLGDGDFFAGFKMEQNITAIN